LARLADELNDLHDYLIEQHKAGKTNVLVVDEAQKMKPPLFELLRQLLNFETSRAKLLQIVLFGQNELVTKIDRMPALKDRVTIFGALTSLTRDDADALIAFRWKVAGGDAHPFEPEALDRIFRYGCGLPRKICNLCNNALIRAYSAKRLRVDAGTIEQVAQEILEQLGDNHSKAFYRLVAAKVPETKIRQILAELKADGANHPVRLFTCKVRRYALTGSP
jgi:general secretion pathway protein A